jgi:hypothetical protein
MSFTKLFQRTTMPFDNGWNSSLSPLTERTRIVPLFGDTPLITDILNHNVSKNVDIHGRGSWGIGDDDFTSFKERGDEFMINDKIAEVLRRINDNKDSKKERWIAITLDGKEMEFASYDIAQRKLREKGIPYKSIIKKVAQKYYYDYMNEALDASFEIQSYNQLTNVKEIGAAFAIDKNLFMTCAHCIKKYNKMQMPSNEVNDPITISLIKDGKDFAAKLKKINFNIDVAIVECNIDSAILEFKPSKEVLIGTRVFTIGSPSGFENNVTEGILSSRDRSIFTHSGSPKYLFTDAHVLPGNSGGALISEADGSVIGMMALIVSGMGLYGLNAAIPSEYLIDFKK